jgi:hypothetical protein
VATTQQWIQGIPTWQKVNGHMNRHPVFPLKHELGTLKICTLEYPPGRDIWALDPYSSGLWICITAPRADMPFPHSESRARLVHLRAEETQVLTAIGFMKEWMPLRLTEWGPTAKYLPVTPEGLPVGYKFK